MSEINHEAAKVYAAECCQFYKECVTDIGHKMSNQEQRELNLSRAYLDLDAQMVEKDRKIRELTNLTNRSLVLLKESAISIAYHAELVRIMEGRQ